MIRHSAYIGQRTYLPFSAELLTVEHTVDNYDLIEETSTHSLELKICVSQITPL